MGRLKIVKWHSNLLETRLKFEGVETTITAEPHDANWGKGLFLDLKSGELDCKLGFACHPEFDDFERYNELTHSELFELVIERIQSGVHDQNIKEAALHGIRLLFVFNGKAT